MASKSPSAFLINVIFEPREDGGLRARCDRLPNFFLSHSDHDLLRRDVEPALETILSEMYGLPMRVERLPTIDEALNDQPTLPAYLCAESYLGRIEA